MSADQITDSDPLQRHLLCRATGQHDPRPNGICRDCGTDATGLPACSPHAGWSMPDEEQS